MLIDLVGGGARGTAAAARYQLDECSRPTACSSYWPRPRPARVNLSVMSTTAARATLRLARRPLPTTRRRRDEAGFRPAARGARPRRPRRNDGPSRIRAGSDGAEDLALQWMALNYHPWVKSEADAAKCLNHLREKEGRVFNLDKAKEVLDSVRADHVKFYPNIPFKLPKTYPGFLLILERSSDTIS